MDNNNINHELSDDAVAKSPVDKAQSGVSTSVTASLAVALLSSSVPVLANNLIFETTPTFVSRVDRVRLHYENATALGREVTLSLPRGVAEDVASASRFASDEEGFKDRAPSWVDWHDFTDSDHGQGERPVWQDG